MRRTHILSGRFIPERNLATNSKIADLNLIIFVHQDIRRLDIPVDDELLVDENHTLDDGFQYAEVLLL